MWGYAGDPAAATLGTPLAVLEAVAGIWRASYQAALYRVRKMRQNSMPMGRKLATHLPEAASDVGLEI
ncbi:MAG: hypothetical protein ACLT76_06425 [Clostridium fessum]